MPKITRKKEMNNKTNLSKFTDKFIDVYTDKFTDIETKILGLIIQKKRINIFRNKIN